MKGMCVIIGALCTDTEGNRNAVTLGCKGFTGFQIKPHYCPPKSTIMEELWHGWKDLIILKQLSSLFPCLIRDYQGILTTD